jgi:hypothetical protein
MSLISRLFDALQSWRRRRVGAGPKTTRRAGLSMEHLDQRQLLSVNFTGNVALDFPASSQPGVVVLPDNGAVIHPTINPEIADFVKVSGVDISGLRVSYTPADDTLNIGIEQPLSQQPGHPGPVVAGDVDNNGNVATLAKSVANMEGTGFQDLPMFGGSKTMGVFLDLKGTGKPDIVAGFAPNDRRSPKPFQVALATPGATSTSIPGFGAELPENEGNVFDLNSIDHPNLEFSITHFSELYTAETGQRLIADSAIKIGAFGDAGNDNVITPAFFPEQVVNLSGVTPAIQPSSAPLVSSPVPRAQDTQPSLPPTEKSASPAISINPRANAHINTALRTRIRVNVMGNSGFDVTKIDPNTVTFGGAHPVSVRDHFRNSGQVTEATFVFRSTDVQLPSGSTDATVSGTLTDGTTFASSEPVFNRSRSNRTSGQSLAQMPREVARDARKHGFVVLPAGSPVASTPATILGPGVVQLNVDMTPSSSVSQAMQVPQTASPAPTGPVVSIPRNEPVSTGQGASAGLRVSRKLQASINRYVRAHGSLNLGDLNSISAGSTGTTSVTPGARVSRKLQSSINRYVRAHGSVNLGDVSGTNIAAMNTVRVDTGPVVSRKLQTSINRYVRAHGSVNLGDVASGGNTSAASVAPAPRVSRKLQSSINRYVRDHGSLNLTTVATAPVGGA